MAQIIDGKALAAQVLARTAAEVAEIVAAGGDAPGLAVILVGNDPASEVYVGRKIAQCRKAGIRSIEHRLPADTAQDVVLALIDELNADPKVHGILVQLPLPKHIDAALVLDRIDPGKDVSAFTPSTSAAFPPVRAASFLALRWGSCSCWIA